MIGRVALAAALALTVALVDLPGPPPVAIAAQSTAAGTLAFVKDNDIWTMSASGGTPKQLTHQPEGQFANGPAFSPDGSQIAYATHLRWTQATWGGAEIHVMSADGSNDRTLVKPTQRNEWLDMPTWYAGGTALFFVHDEPTYDAAGQWLDDTLSLEFISVDSGQRSTLAKNAQTPTTSADGSLAWVSFANGQPGFQLTVLSAGGSNLRNILSDKDFGQIYRPRLSPDGRQIAFSASGPRKTDAAASTSIRGGITLVPRADAHGLPWDPWVINVDGSGLRRLASIGGDEQAISWSPDGQRLAIAGNNGVFALPLLGGVLSRVNTSGDATGLDWKL